MLYIEHYRRAAWRSGKSCLLGKSDIAGSNPTLASEFQRSKMFLPRSIVRIQYCGEPPRPRGSVLGLRPPGLEFRSLCLEGSDISFSSLYVHKGGLKPHSFHFILIILSSIRVSLQIIIKKTR